MASRITDDNTTEFVPALGDSHPHRTNYQLSLARDLNDPALFYARIDKHLTEKATQIPLRVCYGQLLVYSRLEHILKVYFRPWFQIHDSR